MSFTSVVKDEVSKLELSNLEKISELSAIVQVSEVSSYIRIITENNSVARDVFTLFKDLFKINPLITIRKGYNYNKKILYILDVKKNISVILKTLGVGSLPGDFVISDEELIRAYLRGLFMMCASINDPKTSRYHLEFNFNSQDFANFVSSLLNKFYLNSKVLSRENRFMVYIKEAEKIGDFLRIIGASKAVLYYEDIRIYRDHKNMTNRLNNCEQANVDRMIETSMNYIKDIELIKNYDYDLLNEKEKVACLYRLKYRDVSLSELAEIISLETGMKITKSGLYHRFKKIKEIADRVREK